MAKASLKHQQNFGFTLIEVMVTIAIIGLISSTVTVATNNARTRGRDAKRIAEKDQVIKALNLYYDTYGAWPNSGSSVYKCLAPSTDINCFNNILGPLNATDGAKFNEFLPQFPTTNALSGTFAYNRLLFSAGPLTYTGDNGAVRTGAFLLWFAENMTSEICPFKILTTGDAYNGCYIYIGPST
ncbi:MAG: type II secretion system protein [Candidatus Doudnabacteria bacterium]